MEQEQQLPQMPIMAYFLSLKDPRIERNKLYPFHEVIVITFWPSLPLPRAGKTSSDTGRHRSLAEPVSEAGTWHPASRRIPAGDVPHSTGKD
jgi:hypothetical protein